MRTPQKQEIVTHGDSQRIKQHQLNTGAKKKKKKKKTTSWTTIQNIEAILIDDTEYSLIEN